MQNLHYQSVIKQMCLVSISIFILSACNPDKLEIEVYTSDFTTAAENEIVEVPIKASFNILGEDEENILPQAKTAALKFMPSGSEVEISKGQFGKIMTVVSTIPLGTKSALDQYLQKNLRVAMVVVEGNKVEFLGTSLLNQLNKELSFLNMMLGVKFPAESTTFRIIGDSKNKMNISAIAVFSEKKPYIQFAKDVKRRKSLEIEFKGGGDSIYHEIPPQFLIK